MDELISGSTNEPVHGPIHGSVYHQRASARAYPWVGVPPTGQWMGSFMGRPTTKRPMHLSNNGVMNGPIRGPTNKQVHGSLFGSTNGSGHGPIRGLTNGPIHGLVRVPMHGSICGPMHEPANGLDRRARPWADQ